MNTVELLRQYVATLEEAAIEEVELILVNGQTVGGFLEPRCCSEEVIILSNGRGRVASMADLREVVAARFK